MKGPIPDIKVLPHLLASVAHDGLVLANAELFAIYKAGSLRPGLVFVVWVFLQVLFAEPGLLLIVWLLL